MKLPNNCCLTFDFKYLYDFSSLWMICVGHNSHHLCTDSVSLLLSPSSLSLMRLPHIPSVFMWRLPLGRWRPSNVCRRMLSFTFFFFFLACLFCGVAQGRSEARSGQLDQLGQGAGANDLLLLGAFPGETANREPPGKAPLHPLPSYLPHSSSVQLPVLYGSRTSKSTSLALLTDWSRVFRVWPPKHVAEHKGQEQVLPPTPSRSRLSRFV